MNTLRIPILILLISFASIGAVAFTPGLPQIASYFKINMGYAQFAITWYLAGYAVGQLLYGPLTNRLGISKTIFFGSSLSIVGILGCILSSPLHSFSLLLVSRSIMALGTACGLKMTFTILSKQYDKNEGARIAGFLTIAFAITPGLGVFLSGFLVLHFGWISPFYLLLIYSVIMMPAGLVFNDPHNDYDRTALNVKNIGLNYLKQLRNVKIIVGGLLLGLVGSVVYIFASMAPFIAINNMKLSPVQYGAHNFIPAIGILLGSVVSGYIGKRWEPKKSLIVGLCSSLCGSFVLLACLAILSHYHLSLFVPMILVYFGLSFIFGNSSIIALHHAADKSNASAIISFISVALPFVAMFVISEFGIHSAIPIAIQDAKFSDVELKI